MRATSISNELLDSAFQLAYFILGDRAASIYVAMAAMDKVKAASTVQGRRLSYTPIGRPSFPAARSKIALSEVHLLQRLVYIEAELFETLLEGEEQSLQVEDLIIRYIKHLVRITTKHNSFYVTLGLCRLLYNYSTVETAEIYNLILQDPARMRDDHYYRSRKKLLMLEMKERFGDLLHVERGFRREDRFKANDNSATFAGLVKECLAHFTPWQSTCVLPNELDLKGNVIPPLLFEGNDPDEEHLVELNRIHTLIHPPCFARIITALGMDPPDQRLRVPYFPTPMGGARPSPNRFTPKDLSDRELNAIKRRLDKSISYRKKYSDGSLICLVDGTRRTVLEPGPGARVDFEVKAGSDLLEIRSVVAEEEIPIVVYPIAYERSGISRKTSLAVLDGGQEFSFNIEPRVSNIGEVDRAAVRITYQSRKPSNGLLARLRTLGLSPGDFRNVSLVTNPRLIWPALAILVIVILGGLWGYQRSKKADSTRPLIVLNDKQQPATELPSPPATSTPQSQSNNALRRTEQSPGKSPRKESDGRSATSSDSTETDAETRGRSQRPPSATLGSVRRVYVDSLGDDSLSRQFREALIAGLKSTGRFILLEGREDADAVFQASIHRLTHGQSFLVNVELVDASGQIIWSFTSKNRHQQFSRPEDAVTAIVGALLKDPGATARQP
jgi:hypothetical protein